MKPRRANTEEARQIRLLGEKMLRFAERTAGCVSSLALDDPDLPAGTMEFNLAFLMASAVLSVFEDGAGAAVMGVGLAVGNLIGQQYPDEQQAYLDALVKGCDRGLLHAARIHSAGQA